MSGECWQTVICAEDPETFGKTGDEALSRRREREGEDSGSVAGLDCLAGVHDGFVKDPDRMSSAFRLKTKYSEITASLARRSKYKEFASSYLLWSICVTPHQNRWLMWSGGDLYPDTGSSPLRESNTEHLLLSSVDFQVLYVLDLRWSSSLRSGDTCSTHHMSSSPCPGDCQIRVRGIRQSVAAVAVNLVRVPFCDFLELERLPLLGFHRLPHFFYTHHSTVDPIIEVTARGRLTSRLSIEDWSNR